MATLRFIASSKAPVTAQDVAAEFGLHSNAARHHLAKLESAGVIAAQIRRGNGGGRPSKVYTLGPERMDLQFPRRRYDVLSAILLDALGGDRKELALAAGRAGREIVSRSGHIGFPDREPQAAASIETVLRALDSIGFQMEADPDESGSHGFESRNCIFAEAALNGSLAVCEICEGLITGVASQLGRDIRLEYSSRVSSGSETCVGALTVR